MKRSKEAKAHPHNQNRFDAPTPLKSRQQETIGSPATESPTPEERLSEIALPRAKRRRKRAKEDRGLPEDSQLFDLARTYLEEHRRLRPDLHESGLIPEPTVETLEAMVNDFKHRHRGGPIQEEVRQLIEEHKGKLGAGYYRYSCDNSQPTSIADQMVCTLRRSKKDGVFIPWAHIYGDYAVSGTDAYRQGYTSLKCAISDRSLQISVTYIDDFSRASRDELEWWVLARLCKRLNKNLIGASDSFELNSMAGDILMSAYGLLSRLFLKSIKEKNRRGMEGAARRATILGKPGLGFTRRVKLDENGNVMRHSDGSPIHERCIDRHINN